MEIGNQIKALRTQRAVTQETLAEKLGVSAQAVSKWERGSATPDIALLPAISAYFGVSIDELFALSDETRMERIQNMLWDERLLNMVTVEREREFLLEKGRREPGNGKVYILLADIENQLADEHHQRAAEYAREAIKREPYEKGGHTAFVTAKNGVSGDWCIDNKHEVIDFYKEHLDLHPDDRPSYMRLMEHLVNDSRLAEAWEYFGRFVKLDVGFREMLYRGMLFWAEGRHDEAMNIWQRMSGDYPDNWCVWLWMGDVMVRAGRYEEAKEHYRKALETQEAPRYTDGTTSIAHVCEIQGDWAGAIAAHEWELEILRTEWDTTDGEQIDYHRREIARLRGKMENPSVIR